MVRAAILLAGLAIAAAGGLTAQSADAASWVKIDTVTINGVANALPAGRSIHKDYNAGGVYLLKLDPNSLGISFGKGVPRTVTASVMVLANAGKLGRFYSYGLSLDPGPESFVINGPPGADLGMEFFVEDPNPSDNTGLVNITVYQWK